MLFSETSLFFPYRFIIFLSISAYGVLLFFLNGVHKSTGHHSTTSKINFLILHYPLTSYINRGRLYERQRKLQLLILLDSLPREIWFRMKTTLKCFPETIHLLFPYWISECRWYTDNICMKKLRISQLTILWHHGHLWVYEYIHTYRNIGKGTILPFAIK